MSLGLNLIHAEVGTDGIFAGLEESFDEGFRQRQSAVTRPRLLGDCAATDDCWRTAVIRIRLQVAAVRGSESPAKAQSIRIAPSQGGTLEPLGRITAFGGS